MKGSIPLFSWEVSVELVESILLQDYHNIHSLE